MQNGLLFLLLMLTDFEHPCQALTDFLTIKEEFGDFQDLVLLYR